MAVRRFHLSSSFLVALLLYFLLSSRVLLWNFKQSGSSVFVDCFGDSTRSTELNFLPVTGRITTVRHLGIHVKDISSATRITCYPNFVAKYKLARLATSGGISLNPSLDCKAPSTVKKSLEVSLCYL